MAEELSCYAVCESPGRGRAFTEKPHPYRSDFERDRDRVIHCEAFRRLEGKTQVFGPGLDDSYRNRLTHSLEVAQIGRTIAKRLGLNDSLTEAICLAHDLGHSPFGHNGEKVLDDLMGRFGGFEHNRQTLRIVDLLEHPYPDFVGLNLTYETRLGLAKHRSPYDSTQNRSFSEANCSLEGQTADIADRIAYNCHDLEDGMRAGLINSEQLEEIEIFTGAREAIGAEKIKDPAVSRIRTAKAIIDKLVSDCIEASKETIARANIKSLDEVCQHSDNLIVFSGPNEVKLVALEKFLLQNLYQHKSVTKTAAKVEKGLEQLFARLCQKRELMPPYFQRLISTEGLQRSVCDYIAGMTDRFCLKMLEKI